MNIEEIENFLSENDDSFSQKSVLKKWENEISYMIEKKAKQRTILNFILQKDEEIAKTYENRMATLQSMLSQFCARLKKNKSKKRRKNDNSKVDSNSSLSLNQEEFEIKKSNDNIKNVEENQVSSNNNKSLFHKIAEKGK